VAKDNTKVKRIGDFGIYIRRIQVKKIFFNKQRDQAAVLFRRR
jgi:hypothetical protein